MNRPFHLVTLFGVPVFVDVSYVMILAFSASRGTEGLLWALCLTASLLVHELGHALASLYFRLEPTIVLYLGGGLTYHQPARRDRDDAVVIAAGPAAGFAFGLLALAVGFGITLAGEGDRLTSTHLGTAITYLVFLNIVWTCVNLLPMWPLDGGKLFRLIVVKVVAERWIDRVVHGLGVVLGLGMITAAVWGSQPFFAVMAGLMTWDNASILLGRSSSPAVRRRNRHADALLKEARAALAAGDPREAMRLAHQLRAERNLPDDLAGKAWELLVLGSAAAGSWDDVLRYARYAPATREVRAAIARAEAATQAAAGG